MDYVPAHHYELQTFTEKRETSWTYAPHKVCNCAQKKGEILHFPLFQGGEVDGPGRGGAPLPWDMEEPPANMFKEEVLMMLPLIIMLLLSSFQPVGDVEKAK